MADYRSLKRGGFYWEESKPFLSVTTILKVIDKPALRYWFGQQVYWAVVKNPGMNEKEALAAPWQTSGKARNRGTVVHDLVENYTNHQDMIKGTPSDYQGYANAFMSWINDHSPVIEQHEVTVLNRKHRYAGTLDMLATLKDNRKVIVDIKTGKDIYPEAFLQLSAYLHCDGIEARDIAVCLLGEDGTYKFEYGVDQFDTFLAAKQLYEWQNKTTLNNAGYQLSI